MTENHEDTPALLLPNEVAAMLRVDARTVTRWARSGKLRYIRTPGNHRRYEAAQVAEFTRLRTEDGPR